jgi:hypothetical protein
MEHKPNFFARLSRAHESCLGRAIYVCASFFLSLALMVIAAHDDEILLMFVGATFGLMLIAFIVIDILQGLIELACRIWTNEPDNDQMIDQLIEQTECWRKERKDD